MAVPTPCQTNGAMFSTHIEPLGITASVSFGRVIDLTEKEAEILEANIHNVLELVLVPYYRLEG